MSFTYVHTFFEMQYELTIILHFNSFFLHKVYLRKKAFKVYLNSSLIFAPIYRKTENYSWHNEVEIIVSHVDNL